VCATAGFQRASGKTVHAHCNRLHVTGVQTEFMKRSPHFTFIRLTPPHRTLIVALRSTISNLLFSRQTPRREGRSLLGWGNVPDAHTERQRH
jgi:hypothetical protein